MPEEHLKRQLGQLHDELARSREVDPEARELLEDLVQDIETLLARSGDHTSQSLLDRLREATERFEESHPALTAAAGRVANALSNLGI